jgi:hypothetical protein
MEREGKGERVWWVPNTLVDLYLISTASCWVGITYFPFSKGGKED